MRSRASGSTVLAASLTTTAAVMPAFLLGAASTLLRADLALAAGEIGLLVGAFFGAQALTSTWGGRHADRLGPRRAMRACALGAAASLLAIPLLGHTLALLLGVLAAAGTFNGLAQPATNLALAHISRRPAFTYSLKQSSVPFATMVAGLLVPLVAVPLGWRAVFVLAALLAAAVALASQALPATSQPADRPTRRADRALLGDRRPLVVLGAAAGMGTAAATTLAAYLMEGSVQAGMTITAGGWLLSSCGVVGIAGRLLAGWAGDSRPGSLVGRMAWMLAVGAAGFPLLASRSPWLFALGALVVYAFGWGWSGMLWYAVVRFRPAAPAAATGIVSAGAAAGACLGPLGFGALLGHMPLAAAWLVAGGTAILGCACAAVAHSLLTREVNAPAA